MDKKEGNAWTRRNRTDGQKVRERMDKKEENAGQEGGDTMDKKEEHAWTKRKRTHGQEGTERMVKK